MKSYRGFLLDADNTLFDYDRAEREALTEAIRDMVPSAPVDAALALYRPINAGFWRRFEEGAVSLEELKPGRFRALLEALGAKGDPAAISNLYLGRLAQMAFLLPHAKETLERLGQRASLCLVTNGFASVQRGRLEKAGISGLFAAVLISEEIGVSKPDPAFFRMAVEALALAPADLLCVGDGARTDIKGARAFGIDACWYARDGATWPEAEPAPQYTIRDLRELERFAPGL
jgi:YjjG family noncanonical pyrimidine nucleotidase